MKTLIIHPDDRSTDFLRPIYAGIKNKTVLTRSISANTLIKEIEAHDHIMMMGHGSPSGLFNMSEMGDTFLTINSSHVPLLKTKQCVFIWCNADKFVETYGLRGLYTGMFISEVGESNFCRVPSDQKTVSRSNDEFAQILGRQMGSDKISGRQMGSDKIDYSQIHKIVKTEYGVLAQENIIAQYNLDRWYYKPGSKIGTQMELGLFGAQSPQ